MRVIVDDGVGLEVEVRGQGPALVLVHGFGGAKEDFSDHLDELAAGHRVITFDHRGHGESDAPEHADAYSLDRLATDVVAVADALGIDRFRLLGHSMGGMVARRLVLARPDRVEALVLMDTSPGPVPGMDPDIIELGAQLALDQGMDELKRVMDAFSPLGTPAYERLISEREGYQEFCDAKWAALSPVMWATLIREIRDQPDEFGALVTVGCPTLVLVGDQDEPFVAASHAMAATVPDARIVVVPDAGHSPQFENGDDWLRALCEFLADVSTRADRST